jgi:hypothetical protein
LANASRHACPQSNLAPGEDIMTDEDIASHTTRVHGVLALALFALVVATAWYFKSPDFASWIDGYRNQAMGLIS